MKTRVVNIRVEKCEVYIGRSAEMRRLREFECPRNVRRIIHRWRTGQLEPDVRVVA